MPSNFSNSSSNPSAPTQQKSTVFRTGRPALTESPLHVPAYQTRALLPAFPAAWSRVPASPQVRTVVADGGGGCAPSLTSPRPAGCVESLPDDGAADEALGQCRSGRRSSLTRLAAWVVRNTGRLDPGAGTLGRACYSSQHSYLADTRTDKGKTDPVTVLPRTHSPFR